MMIVEIISAIRRKAALLISLLQRAHHPSKNKRSQMEINMYALKRLTDAEKSNLRGHCRFSIDFQVCI